MTTYTSNIPQPSDDPSQSQDQILQNFQSLNTANSVNHIAYNDADEGKHKFLQMPEQGSAPTTAADEGAVYTKVSNSTTELFWRRESNGTEVQLTDGTPTAAGKGETFLPGGILIQWGTGTGTSGGSAVSFLTSFTTIYQVVATAQNTSGTSVAVESITNAGFTAYTSVAGPITVRYIAIGLA